MQPSMFNLRVPLPARDEVFLMNTLTDAQLVVSPDVAELLDRAAAGELPSVLGPTENEQYALNLLSENGFLVENRTADRRRFNDYITGVKSSTDELNVTILTTLQCNFACDYCFQGDHGDYNLHADKMSMATAARVGDWIERELDRVRPERLVLTFFGGEPLLNLPVMYQLSERLWNATQERGVKMFNSIITNGLLLTPEVVDRMQPFGLNGIKITLDGDRDTHNRMRPLRGGQGTFDRIIENIRR
ncbi:MAG TPA: radical SAM protein, partial [Vicinamibacterales bacterium]